ncbi:MAG: DNA polymerase III subunit alpha [Candidatus Eisenbacteria bacterium]|uniref:DNA polymerase III subunit alpha n=1 Tax=Eiseniibacteriota bacterium TaxID=2212470 RepID=A0A933W8K6_UNCEI|nr:DNA polymerase III subunit alpha [Candidatus Eisenbacteria bacterium]
MKHSDFVHLHNHSDYSLLDGASTIPAMVKKAAKLNMPALALTDHGSMFGAVEFYNDAKKAGVKPIVGMEAYVTRNGRATRKPGDVAHHLVLLARDEAGFRNLMRLSSLAYLEGFYYKPRVDHELLSKYSAGLLALSACPKGEIAYDLLEDRDDDALKTAMMYRDIFGAENFFLEIQNHGLDIETKIRSKVAALAAKTGLPLVATNDCHYLEKDHTEAQDVLICIQTGKNVDDAQRMRAVAELHFRSPDEMQHAFSDQPQALLNTLAVAERCNLKMDFGKPLLPEFPLPEGWANTDEYFRDLAWKELHARMGSELGDACRQRFAYELDVICKMGFASYFLIVRDFIAFARENGIGVGPGRGSAAGSLVAFALRITDVDPLKHQLIFERFLNPERVSMPDIDIDFDDLRRGEVIEYVKRKYGETNVTQIITFGTMGAKGVVRDTGRALGFPVAEVDRVAKLVPDGLGMTLDKALEQTPDLRALPEKGGNYAKWLKSAQVLEGLARHASTHAAGVLITPGPLLDYVPLYRQKDGSTTTQWDMKSVEKSGLLKMDFLGLRTLSVLDECVRLVKQHHGVDVDWHALELTDPAAYKVFQDGDTVAIFQFESAGMRDYMKKLKPTVFEDLVAMNALYRPGPMENIPYFIDCKHGRQVAKYDHPKLKPILEGTYGVFVYQEQVMASAHDLAGFSMAQADELRRAMGKKIVEEMAKKRVQFIEGCAKASHIPEKIADKIFTTMEKFAGYGFNKSHSAAYALVAYQCAYLKGHWPAAFMAATMTSEMSDSVRVLTLIEEVRRLGIELLPPDVNKSNYKFTLEDGKIRIGLGAVRNVGQGAIEALVAARDEGGAFRDVFDLTSRVAAGSFNRKVLESLVMAGACDGLNASRESLFAGAALALDHASTVHREKASGPSSLFGGGDDAGASLAVSAPALPVVPAWDQRDKGAKEKEVLGFYLSGHPLEHLREEIERIATCSITQALERGDGSEVRIVGIVSHIKPITTKAGKLMAIVAIEDLAGRAECTFFPEAWETARPLVTADAIIVVSGRIEVREERGAQLLVSEVRPWEQGREQFRPALHVELRAEDITEERLAGIDEALSAFPGDSEVYLHIVRPDHSRVAMRSRRLRVGSQDGLIPRIKERAPMCRVRWGKGAS